MNSFALVCYYIATVIMAWLGFVRLGMHFQITGLANPLQSLLRGLAALVIILPFFATIWVTFYWPDVPLGGWLPLAFIFASPIVYCGLVRIAEKLPHKNPETP